MVGIVVFNVLMIALGLTVLARVVPRERVSNTLGYLHNSIGITTPPLEQVRMIALIWIGSVIVIVDGCIFLLVFIASMSNVGMSNGR
jgi:hypothetical protein